MAGFVRLLKQKHNPPRSTEESFAGKTVLITGATTGLGLEAAKHFLRLDANNLIVTCRNATRGVNAKKTLEASRSSFTSKKRSLTEIHVMELDMSKFDSVKSFAREVTAKFTQIDVAILNAGTHQSSYFKTTNGWEEDIQVNAVATTLLGLLLLPKLMQSADNIPGPTYLTFISSGMATVQKPTSYKKYYDSPNALKAMGSEDAWPGARQQYGLSKLLLEYSMRNIAKLPSLRSDDGRFRVVVNSTCPGMCKSDLGRDMIKGILMKIFAWIIFTLFARSAEQGSNSYVSAVTRDSTSQGQLWKDDSYYNPGVMITSEEGKAYGEKVWKEMKEAVENIEPKVAELVRDL